MTFRRVLFLDAILRSLAEPEVRSLCLQGQVRSQVGLSLAIKSQACSSPVSLLSGQASSGTDVTKQAYLAFLALRQNSVGGVVIRFVSLQ